MERYTVTRTVIVNTITCRACDPETAELFNFSFIHVGTMPTEKNLKKLAQKSAPNNSVVVSIVDVATKKALLGQTEKFFIENSVELDPRTRKPLSD